MPKRTIAVLVIILYAIDSKDGERGRNRTYNLLIKSSSIRTDSLLGIALLFNHFRTT